MDKNKLTNKQMKEALKSRQSRFSNASMKKALDKGLRDEINALFKDLDFRQSRINKIFEELKEIK